MTRVLVVGPRDELERTIESLYDLRLLHLVDHRAEGEGVGIGKALPRAAEASEGLVKLRSIASILKVEEPAKGEEAPSGELRAQIMTLELNLREEDEARKKVDALLQDLDRRIEALTPFAPLRLPLDLYRGHATLEPIVGRVTSEVTGLEAVAPEHEVFQAEGAVAVFVPKDRDRAVREHLARFGFAPLEVPEGTGDPRELLSRAQADRQRWAARRSEAEERIAKLRDRYARFLLRAEDLLQTEVEKAEAPLRFAVSEHSFVIDGWIPTSRRKELEAAMAAIPGLHLEVLPDGTHGHEEADMPVLLRNPGPTHRFEFLTKMHSTPRPDELDPTSFLFVVFPIFFGLMIGDAGYGIVMIFLGFFLARKFGPDSTMGDLFRIFYQGGIFAFLFGLLLFGDLFGIPIHSQSVTEVDWSGILGYNVPYLAPIHKLDTVGVIDLIYLSIIASSVHLGLGFVAGFVNEVRHDKRHAISRIGWILVLLGLLSIFAVLARTPTECATTTTPWCTTVSHRVANRLFFDQPPLAWIPGDKVALLGIQLPTFSILVLVAGLGILIPTEGPLAVTEVVSLLANMFSYARLAGVAVAKGAMAVVFNSMLLGFIINQPAFEETRVVQWNPNVLLIVAGFFLLVIAHAMVLILGSLSAGIQALRLNYVEFFLKFYKGGGQEFTPFGARKPKPEV